MRKHPRTLFLLLFIYSLNIVYMKCNYCDSKVKSDTEYSIHMNTKHRGKQYKPFVAEQHLNKEKEIKNYESKIRKSNKKNVDYRMEE